MLPQPNQIIIPLSPPAVLCAPPTSEQRRSRQETERKGDASGTHVRPDSLVGEIFFFGRLHIAPTTPLYS